ncbi:MAG: TIGR00730 family Rossman fold protein [Nanoarchaeota archaeon]|nr:TIGR00730 family Rossman fold protein [Nanoarchaeota archaeon]
MARTQKEGNGKNGTNGILPKRIQEALGIHSHEIESWRIFKILSEFVQGFEFIRKYKKAVTFFGSARSSFDASVYKEAAELAARLAKDGYAVMTGGGSGVMEAANKGAYEAGGDSVGINIQLPKEQRTNKYVTDSEAFHYFFTRKVMLSFASDLYIFFPGGFGTLDEFFEMITLVQTKKIPQIPIILVNKEFWTPLLKYIEEVVYKKNKAIDKGDMYIYYLVDNADEAYQVIKKLTK